MTTQIKWHGDRLGRQMEEAAARAVQRSAVLVMTRARLLTNVPAKRTRRRRVRTTSAGNRGSQYTTFSASRPGQPPALRTGFGRRNIDMAFFREKLLARVGVRVNAKYMIYHELGTGKLPVRPWLRPAVEQSRPMIAAIFRAEMGRAAK